MATYTHYEKLLDEAAKARDLKLVGYLLDGLALMDSGHLIQANRVFRAVLDSADLAEVADLFFAKLGVDQKTAISYFEGLINNPDLPRSDLQNYIEHLGDGFAAVFVSALYKGDAEIAKTLKQRYASQFPLRLDDYKSINGHTISAWAENMSNCRNSEEVRQIFELVVESGLSSLVGKNTEDDTSCKWMVSSSRWASVIELTRAAQSKLPLPILANGVVRNPEMLMALAQELSTTHYPELYNKTIAWISDADLQSATVPAITTRTIRTFGTGIFASVDTHNLCDFDLNRVSALKYEKQGSERVGLETIVEVNVGLQVNNGNLLEGEHFSLLGRYFLSDETLAGLNHPKGYTLCMVDTQWLAQFEAAAIQEDLLNEAHDFVSGFFPVNIFYELSETASDYAAATPNPTGIVEVAPYDARKFFLLLEQERTRAEILKIIPEELWRYMFEQSQARLKAQGLLLAKEHLGLELTQFASVVRMSTSTLRELAAGGYNLWVNQENGERASILLEKPNSERKSSLLDVYQNVIMMGGWPDDLPEFNSIQEAITKGVRVQDATLQMAYLRAMGAEQVIPLVKTKAQWEFFFRTFENSEITPHLDRVPEHLRADILADDLGL
ncbi:hypothetical protein DV532_29795 (plasmid) [Pseudomonas sp. Leaf58]|uniref:hypothetical protein n=1 Tax=Pseudomonas sp. Leaf58 TaxID=1736226 RepID=UPI0006F4C1A9|nr:hypothetical protein [Pseudomonas sp. Leaf58]AYG48433.1 hypothetical protein DV532_29795 [Pseudomonas sp. Leaf58]KQN62022.1 hypothetical protein ASF02_07525 [Pseudomonas sp. Leaf58]